jgi:hypothetical protein
MKEMTIQEILRADLEKNYPGENLTVDEYAEMIHDDIKNGHQLFRDGNMLVIYEPLKDDAIELHVINGFHKMEDMVKRVFKIMIQLQMDGIKEVRIPYDNPALEKIIKTIPVFPKETKKIDDGPGRTYMTKVRLG